MFKKSSKLASFAQLQFNSMNICLFLIKFPILVKISPTIIHILKWSLKVYHFLKRAFLLIFDGVDSDVNIDAIVTLAKQKQNGVQ